MITIDSLFNDLFAEGLFSFLKFVMDSSIEKLAIKGIKLSGKSKKELDRTCWMVVHEYKHGVMPSEYDIRDIDESLYLEVLKRAKAMVSK